MQERNNRNRSTFAKVIRKTLRGCFYDSRCSLRVCFLHGRNDESAAATAGRKLLRLLATRDRITDKDIIQLIRAVQR